MQSVIPLNFFAVYELVFVVVHFHLFAVHRVLQVFLEVVFSTVSLISYFSPLSSMDSL